MIARSAFRCSATRRNFSRFRSRFIQVKKCGYSTTSTTSNAASSASLVSVFTNELDKIGPRIDIRGSKIHIIQTPAEFYSTLKAKIRNAETRIFLSTLYIGKTEHELISIIHEALKSKPALKLYVLTDALRGTREAPKPCTASLLVPLVDEFGPDRVQIRMYHTPNLTGMRKRLIPKRVNEGWGLQHMKLYGVDDEIIISGANLSSDYFTNRQDRYHLFSSKEITDYFWSIHDALSRLSFLVSPNFNEEAGFVLAWPEANPAPSPLEHPEKYVSSATSLLESVIKATPGKKRALSSDTMVYPLSQLTQILKPNTSTEFAAITAILRTLASPPLSGSSWTFTAGYFNPDPLLTKLLINTSSSRGIVVTASPWANGFYGSRGISGLLPPAYTLLARRFLEAVQRAGRSKAILLKEWRNGTVGKPGGWTYHAKGLWVNMPGDKDPCLTLIGSSNYTKRSYSLDLEVNTLIVTEDPDLKRRLGEEQAWLQEHAKEIGIDDFTKIDRRVGIKVRIAMWIVSLMGGAL